MAFTAKDVQALRERTNCGMMDCKKALTATDGDMENAIEFLREKGLAAQAKKAGRIAAEGLVYTLIDPATKKGVIIEVNIETDFAAKNQRFKDFVALCAKTILEKNPATVAELLETKASGSEETINEVLQGIILVISENIQVRRFEVLEGNLFSYTHGGGRIGVLVNFKVDDAVFGTPAFEEYAKDIAMQVAAANPSFLDKNSVDQTELDKEREILRIQAINEGKPEAIVEKMLAGRLNKYYKEVCLTEQPFIKDDEISVAKYTQNVAKELGSDIQIVKFVRFEVGEGIQKKADDFASEVAAMAGTK